GGVRPVLFHLGFREPCPPRGRPFQPVGLPVEATLEVVLRPGPDQVPCATIISNHPGVTEREGFTIEQQGGATNRCNVSVGAGHRWHVVGKFQLTPGVWSHVAVVTAGETTKVYLNGRCVSTGTTRGLGRKDSGLPLRIGNWVQGNRPFQGIIREVRLL